MKKEIRLRLKFVDGRILQVALALQNLIRDRLALDPSPSHQEETERLAEEIGKVLKQMAHPPQQLNP